MATASVVEELNKLSKKEWSFLKCSSWYNFSKWWERNRRTNFKCYGKGWKRRSYYGRRSKSLETTLDVVEGMQFDRGYLSPYFVTNAEKMIAELEDPYI